MSATAEAQLEDPARSDARTAQAAHDATEVPRDAAGPLDRDGLLRAMQRLTSVPPHRGDARAGALVLFRLADLRAINESDGPAAGDALLEAAVRRLSAATGSRVIARVGGAVLAAWLDDPRIGAVLRATRAAKAELGRPVRWAGGEVASGIEMGCAFWPEDARGPAALLLAAETALAEGRAVASPEVTFFLPEMAERRAAERTIARELKHALDEGSLALAFQPIQDLRTGELVAVEALARWNHPRLGPIPPARFIPVAERAGLIGGLGRFVLRAACAEIAEWRRRGLPAIRVAINLSPDEFIRSEIVETVAMALVDADLPPDALILELTEGIIVRDPDAAGRAMERLADLGVTIALDDFGSGYASFGHLRRFPIHELKMDRCLISVSDDRPCDRRLAEAVVALGHDLGVRVVAEGVETVEQLRWLRAAGVDEIQGYVLAPPMTPAACHAFCVAHDPALGRDDGPAPGPNPPPPRPGAEPPVPASH